MIMPYAKILGSSTSHVNIIKNSIQCSESTKNIKLAAETCFEKLHNGDNCVGFLKSGKNVFLCNVLSRNESSANTFTTIASNQTLFLLKVPEITPDVHISMDEFNLNTGTITGKGVSGGSHGITADDLIPGKVGQAINFHSGGRIYPAVEQPECFCSFYYCNGKMSLSFWARRSTSTSLQHVITSPSGLTVAFNRDSAGSAGWFNVKDIHVKNFGM